MKGLSFFLIFSPHTFMIYYFSGTGNSKRIAQHLSKVLNEETASIPLIDPITEHVEGNMLGIVCPIYAWGIPPIVLEFISKLDMKEIVRINREKLPVWVVLSYGDEAGNALSMMTKVIQKRGLSLDGAWGIQTPNVYVMLPGFDVDPKDLERKKLEALIPRCDQIAGKIMKREWETDVHRGPLAWLKTATVYPLFKHWGVDTKQWHCDHNTCVSCGQCSRVCPVNNIAMETISSKGSKKYPVWGTDCTSCCACYHICPTHSISYSTFTKNKGQFQPE